MASGGKLVARTAASGAAMPPHGGGHGGAGAGHEFVDLADTPLSGNVRLFGEMGELSLGEVDATASAAARPHAWLPPG
jgi:hypothetical protein